jgi:glucokinase
LTFIALKVKKKDMILAGDIGATKTVLALFDKTKCVKEERYESKQYAGLEPILKLFLKEKVEAACFGVAGPVIAGRCKTTNLPWIVEEAELKKQLKTDKVQLINDLEANGWGIGVLSSSELLVLNRGDPSVKGNGALISAGTGLGQAGLYWDGQRHHPFASEGGHTDFAPRDELEVELLRHLQHKFGHVSYERVVSGPGLQELYQFLIDRGLEQSELKQVEPHAIIEKAMEAESKTCSRALRGFISLYGSEAGNLALKFMARGGLYLGGGIAPTIVSALQEGGFLQAFIAKGRFKPLLSSIPIKVILNDKTALLGAAECARQLH